MKKPAENTCTPLFALDFKCSPVDVADDATEHNASLLWRSFTLHALINFMSLLICCGSCTVKAPFLVFTSFLKLNLVAVSWQSTATEAPVIKWLDFVNFVWKQVSQ